VQALIALVNKRPFDMRNPWARAFIVALITFVAAYLLLVIFYVVAPMIWSSANSEPVPIILWALPPAAIAAMAGFVITFFVVTRKFD
jgi:hypothetical protein